MIAAALGFWVTLSPLVAWVAGRFIRVGMVDLQRKQASQLPEPIEQY